MTELAPPSPSPANAEVGIIAMVPVRAAETVATDRGARIAAVKVMTHVAMRGRRSKFLIPLFIGNSPLSLPEANAKTPRCGINYEVGPGTRLALAAALRTLQASVDLDHSSIRRGGMLRMSSNFSGLRDPSATGRPIASFRRDAAISVAFRAKQTFSEPRLQNRICEDAR
jgi:hypothetical protein